MRFVICGAGKVGYSIADYLSRETNSITIIDKDPALIDKITSDLDVNGLVGNAASPEVLSNAGLAEADMIIAVTYTDEVNMVACQVAHSLFNVPKKIARVRSQDFLNPAWINLFSRDHMPIDVIISPEVEVAKAIHRRLMIVGATEVIPIHDNKAFLIGVICQEDCPILNTPLAQLRSLFPDLSAEIVSIIRGGQAFVPQAQTQLHAGDEVYFVSESGSVERAMKSFGYSGERTGRTVIIGGGNVGFETAQLIKNSSGGKNLTVIEQDKKRAKFLSQNLDDTLVLHGDGLNPEMLKEASIDKAETIIAVSNNDETNALSALEAKQFGCKRAMALVTRGSYANLLLSINIDAIISPQDITVSKILRYVRRGRIKAVTNLRNSFAEFIEAEASESCRIINTPLRDLDIPDEIHISAIIRDENFIMPNGDTVIRPGDFVVIFALEGFGTTVERLFSVDVDLF
ncbi:MAG: Trk system potassium transporter TrkA [Alphaproteobacteria bacterium]|nr:Trk system potassium transporter TrkA [Alphaproteobacteria bacterium]|tara:strand:+ start:1419 stop:2795 length:1377 start_codon:yes stop_codon:yes gene_type:complete